jgi:hypothetical protein
MTSTSNRFFQDSSTTATVPALLRSARPLACFRRSCSALGMVANNANLVYKLLGDCLGVLCAEEENNRGSRRKERKAQELTSEE